MSVIAWARISPVTGGTWPLVFTSASMAEVAVAYVPMVEEPFGPYGPMKKPSGRANRSSAAAAHRIVSGCVGVGSGTGTRTPPSGTHWRQSPLEMNNGTAGRSVVSNGFGAIGTNAAMTATGTTNRSVGRTAA